MVSASPLITERTTCFNPCFNGFMDKWWYCIDLVKTGICGFNPCFNGFMDKWSVLKLSAVTKPARFNPCFNGFMDKWLFLEWWLSGVSMFQPLF